MIVLDIIVYLWVVGLMMIPVAYITAEIRNDEEDYEDI